MKKNTKKSMILFGTALTVLLMVSSATAVTQQHIDKNIRITKNHEKMLMNAYKNTDNERFRAIIESILELFDEGKKVVNSNDIKTIIDKIYDTYENGYTSSFYFLRKISTTECPKYMDGFPRTYPALFPLLPQLGGLLWWQADYLEHYDLTINIQIGPDLYPCPNDGIVLNFFGNARLTLIPTNPDNPDEGYQGKFDISGLGFMIMIEHPAEYPE